jgi:hypothetical protein
MVMVLVLVMMLGVPMVFGVVFWMIPGARVVVVIVASRAIDRHWLINRAGHYDDLRSLCIAGVREVLRPVVAALHADGNIEIDPTTMRAGGPGRQDSDRGDSGKE